VVNHNVAHLEQGGRTARRIAPARGGAHNAAMEPRVRYARTSDGVDIAYATVGEGPLLLVARPLLRAAVDGDLQFMMDPWLATLAERRTIVVWDFRGSGLSAGVEPQYTLETALLDLEAVAAAVSPDAPIDLLASLTPAQTAIAFAARQPHRTRRLILVNPSAGFSPRKGTLTGLPDIVDSHFREFIQLAALRIMGWRRAEIAEKWQHIMLRQFTPESWSRLMDEMEAIGASDEAAQIRAPTLVLIDEQSVDRVTVQQTRRRSCASLRRA
jgi:pimeloyl-ACP methyl ester carboxylesterase